MNMSNSDARKRYEEYVEGASTPPGTSFLLEEMEKDRAAQALRAGSGRKPTPEEVDAIMFLVRSGWLRLELNVGDQT